MAEYVEFYFRSPDKQTFVSDLKAALQEAGIDPYEEKAVVESEEGDRLSQGIDVIEPQRWYETEPEYDEEGSVVSEGTLGDYALINIRTNEQAMQQVCESVAAQDPALDPSEVPDSEKVGGGSHRVEEPSSPVRRFATA